MARCRVCGDAIGYRASMGRQMVAKLPSGLGRKRQVRLNLCHDGGCETIAHVLLDAAMRWGRYAYPRLAHELLVSQSETLGVEVQNAVYSRSPSDA